MDLTITLKDIPQKDFDEWWERARKSAVESNGMVFPVTENIELNYPEMRSKSSTTLDLLFMFATALYGHNNAVPSNELP